MHAVNRFSSKCDCAIHLAATDHDEFITLVAGKRPSLLIAGNNDEVYGKKPQHYAEDNLRSGKSEASVTIIKDSARVIVLLSLTTDGHKASRGFAATAELLVSSCCKFT